MTNVRIQTTDYDRALAYMRRLMTDGTANVEEDLDVLQDILAKNQNPPLRDGSINADAWNALRDFIKHYRKASNSMLKFRANGEK